MYYKLPIGRFRITHEYLENSNCYDSVMALMGKVIILKAEDMLNIGCIEYTAMSKLFDENTPGSIVPMYTIVADINNDGVQVNRSYG